MTHSEPSSTAVSRLNIQNRSIRITGTVQGVGFRPFVWHLAQQMKIGGSVRNDGHGVHINAWGYAHDLDNFEQKLRHSAPPLARVSGLESVIECDSHAENRADNHVESQTLNSFVIAKSLAKSIHTDIVADAATCQDCFAEIFDPADRRYRYPFTNCTHCGPRLSIVKAIPYDRANTSMAAFTLCADCQHEYESAENRRFHAQPNACPNCGPKLWLEDNRSEKITEGNTASLEEALRLIETGSIIAIKGIGGFHLICDAGSQQVVSRLRRRKHRYQKAFALIARDHEMVEQYACVNKQERALLESSAAPIVVLERSGCELAESVAPGLNSYGFMLPYTPLHHLLMAGIDRPLVMTSANRNGEPPYIGNAEARQGLSDIADAFLMHDRGIVNRLDDSVVAVNQNETVFFRRARGYAPEPIRLSLKKANHAVLAIGADLKNTFCLLNNGNAIISQYIGDLEDVKTYDDARSYIDLYKKLYQFNPQAIAVDMHPGYFSTRLGQQLAEAYSIPCIEVQHHHAHIAACMAENGVSDDEAVLGIALDGLGYGTDGTFWGGEILLARYDAFERLAHFQPVAMPGGNQSIHEPWRSAYAHLTRLGWQALTHDFQDVDIMHFLSKKPLSTLDSMIARNVNSPLSSSCGRLFDAVSAVLGIHRERVAFEGQAAIELEVAACRYFYQEVENYYRLPQSMAGDPIKITWEELWRCILTDLSNATEVGIIAARFHHALIHHLGSIAATLAEKNSVKKICLSGGVFQNRLLSHGLIDKLQASGFEVMYHQKLPPNDGCISLGQAVCVARFT